MMKRLCLLVALFLAGTKPVLAGDFSTHLHMTTPPRLVGFLIFEDANGVQHSLSDYRGRYVLLNLWAGWCMPCVQEMPSLDVLQTRFDPYLLTVVPLSEDRGGGSVVAGFFLRHQIMHLPVAVDPSGMAPSVLQARGLPLTLLIDPQGREVARFEGNTDWASTEAINFLHAAMVP